MVAEKSCNLSKYGVDLPWEKGSQGIKTDLLKQTFLCLHKTVL